MKIMLYKMKGCKLCDKAIKLFKHWNIKFESVYDEEEVEEDTEYPYAVITVDYKELVNMIAKGVLK